MIRVYLVDDQEIVRSGLSLMINAQSDMVVAGTSSDGRAALDGIRRAKPDLVLMDISMPGMDGIATTRALQEIAPVVKVVGLTTYDTDENAYAMLRAGASGFLLKDAPGEEILSAIRHVASGDAVIAPATTRRPLAKVVERLPEPGDPLDPLTPRERDVYNAVAQGLGNAEIARRLRLATGTVRIHVSRILAKLGLRDRVHLVIHAYRTGHPEGIQTCLDE